MLFIQNVHVCTFSFESNTVEIPGALASGDVPALVIRDAPDRTLRAIYEDFSGCRVLNTETVGLGYCIYLLTDFFLYFYF